MLEIIVGVLTKWFIWAPLALVLGYLTIRNNRRANHIDKLEHVLLALDFPKGRTKNEIAAEEVFNSLHGILRDRRELFAQGGWQEHISFEVAASGQGTRFFIWLPKHLQNFVEGQILAQYPEVKIYLAQHDYTKDNSHKAYYNAELTLTGAQVLPIKTYTSFTSDPLETVLTTMTQVQPEEEAWLQVLIRPVASDWHRQSERLSNRLKSGGPNNIGASTWLYFINMLQAMWRPPQGGGRPAEPSEHDKAKIEAITKKRNKPGFKVKIRLVCAAPQPDSAKLRLQTIAGTFKQFTEPNINGLELKNGSFTADSLAEYRARFFIDKGFILNSEELATIFHLPYNEATRKLAEVVRPDSPLPILTGTDKDNSISAFGVTEVQDQKLQFGIYRSDRNRHMYVIGQTGTGKTGLLELLALSDVYHHQGYAIIDPHGDFAANNLRFIPSWRAEDVVYFNPADTANPIGFNPMEVINSAMKSIICSEVIGVLKRMFGDSWGPRLEHILRFTILALLDYPGTTLLDITRMLTDKRFREAVLASTSDTVVKQFWYGEFATWNERFAAEAIAPVLNKVGAFTANPIIRNIIGQPKSTFNIRALMDQGKILIVNLSKGLIGEDNASTLGAFLVTKIQLAAMSRSDIARVEDRKPFYLYVDEFQNFATDSFATILSEARKYGLNLVLANQYVSQMAPSVRDAVFGNVGTLISFRLSADDAPILQKHFEPAFKASDLVHLHNRQFLASMVVKEAKIPPFAGATLNLPPVQVDLSADIIEHTRRLYASPRDEVEKQIKDKIGQGRQTHPRTPVKRRQYIRSDRPKADGGDFIIRLRDKN